MRTSVFCYALCAALICPAQDWCHPGSEWRYTTYVLATDLEPVATKQVVYAGDTLFQGEECQFLRSWTHATTTNGQPQILGPDLNFTTTSPDLIRFWNAVEDSFDTLVYFGAGPGATWRFDYLSDTRTITVLDTGSRSVNGVSLRFTVVDPGTGCICAPPDTIYERIGALQLFNPFPLLTYFIDFSNGPLNCYRDDDFEFEAPYYDGDCSIMLGTEPPVTRLMSTLAIYPNPGSDMIRFDMWANGQIVGASIFDAQGGLVLEVPRLGGQRELDLTGFAPGFYTILVLMDDGKVRPLRWIKE